MSSHAKEFLSALPKAEPKLHIVTYLRHGRHGSYGVHARSKGEAESIFLRKWGQDAHDTTITNVRLAEGNAKKFIQQVSGSKMPCMRIVATFQSWDVTPDGSIVMYLENSDAYSAARRRDFVAIDPMYDVAKFDVAGWRERYGESPYGKRIGISTIGYWRPEGTYVPPQVRLERGYFEAKDFFLKLRQQKWRAWVPSSDGLRKVYLDEIGNPTAEPYTFSDRKRATKLASGHWGRVEWDKVEEAKDFIMQIDTPENQLRQLLRAHGFVRSKQRSTEEVWKADLGGVVHIVWRPAPGCAWGYKRLHTTPDYNFLTGAKNMVKSLPRYLRTEAKEFIKQAAKYSRWKTTAIGHGSVWFTNQNDVNQLARLTWSGAPGYEVTFYTPKLDNVNDVIRLGQEQFTLPNTDMNQAAAEAKKRAMAFFAKRDRQQG